MLILERNDLIVEEAHHFVDLVARQGQSDGSSLRIRQLEVLDLFEDALLRLLHLAERPLVRIVNLADRHCQFPHLFNQHYVHYSLRLLQNLIHNPIDLPPHLHTD
jgi:hypothetical protein